MQSSVVYINDSFVAEEKAAIFVNDLAIQRGYGIFDFFKTIQGKFIFIDDHLDRFFHSASRMHLAVGQSREELKNVLYELSRKNNIPDSGIKITLTGGYSEDGYSLQKPNLIITQKPLSFSNNDLSTGLKLITYEHQRQLPDVKTIDYLMAIWLKPLIAEKGADDVLYHKDGIVTECPRSNIFIVTHDETIITPADNILKGVTRKHLIEVAKGKFVVEEKDVSIGETVKAKEVFITSTTKQVLPVMQVDDHLIGNGKPGKITLWLRDQMSQLIGVVQ